MRDLITAAWSLRWVLAASTMIALAASAVVRRAEVVRWLGRVIATGKRLARDETVPRWLRWLFVFGLMPVPLFLDEIALIAAVATMALLYRDRLRAAWEAQ